MALDTTTLNALLVMAAVLVIPGFPAVLIYKVLPEQKILVKGDFNGFQLNASGAVALYFVLVILAREITTKTLATRGSPYDTWTIVGWVRVDDPADSVYGATLAVVPPPHQDWVRTGSVGRFSTVATLRRDGSDGGAMLQVLKPPYSAAMYPIDGNSLVDPITRKKYRIQRDEITRVVTIQDTLILARIARPYSEVVPYDPELKIAPRKKSPPKVSKTASRTSVRDRAADVSSAQPR